MNSAVVQRRRRNAQISCRMSERAATLPLHAVEIAMHAQEFGVRVLSPTSTEFVNHGEMRTHPGGLIIRRHSGTRPTCTTIELLKLASRRRGTGTTSRGRLYARMVFRLRPHVANDPALTGTRKDRRWKAWTGMSVRFRSGQNIDRSPMRNFASGGTAGGRNSSPAISNPST